MALIGFVAACNSPSKEINEPRYMAEVDSLRKSKDNEFAISNNGPFSDNNEIFKGLNYFPVKPEYRIHARWIKDGNYIREISDSKGGIREYR
jgi:uncharacterized protein (DUF1684 family)